MSEPLTPRTPEYEDIWLREITFGFVGGSVEEITLYPEDSIATDPTGDTLITFHTKKEGDLPAPTFSVHPRNVTWTSSRYVKHRRVKGTLRPTPEQVMAAFAHKQQQERQAKMERIVSDLVRDGLVDGSYRPGGEHV